MRNKSILLALRNWLTLVCFGVSILSAIADWKLLLLFCLMMVWITIGASLEYYNDFVRMDKMKHDPEKWVNNRSWPCPRAAMKLYIERPDLR